MVEETIRGFKLPGSETIYKVGTEIPQSDTPPTDDSLVWLDTSNTEENGFYNKTETNARFATKVHASHHGKDGADPITPEMIGAASLDEKGKVPANQLPDMNYIPTTDKGQPNGVCPLGPDGKIPLEYGGGVPITLTANTEAGSKVTVTDGVTTMVDENSTGISTFSIPNAGEWTATAEKDGANLGRGKADIVDNYNVQLSTTYTVKIALANDNPETACTYTDDAVGMTPGYDGWKDTRLFKSIKPCIVKDGAFQYYLNPNNLAQKETGEPVDITSTATGDVMVEIPKIGYRMWKDSDYQYVSVTEEQNKPDYCYRAHSLDNEGDCDKIYIGAFLGWNSGNKIYSLSGKSPLVNVTLAKARDFIQAKGAGYQMLSFYPITLLQCLYLIKYKNRNSQAAVGKGYTGGSSSHVTGGTVKKGTDYGSKADAKQQMCFLNIEDLWGNLNDWVDGFYSDDSFDIKTAFKDFNDTGVGYPYTQKSGFGSDTNGFISDVQGTNDGGFFMAKSQGSGSTYYADNCYISKNRHGYFGGPFSHGDKSGIFMLYLFSAKTVANEYNGCRIVFKHKEVTA